MEKLLEKTGQDMWTRKNLIALQCLAMTWACQFHLKYKDTFSPEPVKAKTSGLPLNKVVSPWMNEGT